MLSSNVNPSLAQKISSLANIPRTNDMGMYLSLSLIDSRASHAFFQYLIDKLIKKLSGWMNTLSFAESVTLTKHVLNSLPFYSMQVV